MFVRAGTSGRGGGDGWACGWGWAEVGGDAMVKVG